MKSKLMLLAATGLTVLAMTVPAMAASPAYASGVGTTRTMVATAYGPSAQDNYPYPAVDYFGAPLRAGDIAVDPNVIPLGSKISICGYSSPYLPPHCMIGTADDEGGAIKGNRIDIFMNASPSAVSAFGIQRVRVTLLSKG